MTDHAAKDPTKSPRGRVYLKADTLNRRLVAGERMTISLGEFAERCACQIEDEQRQPLPDNGRIALWCEAIRLTREYELLYLGSER